MPKRVLITEGTRGFGASLVDQYLAKGLKVIATGRSQATVDKSSRKPPEVEWLVCDQSSDESINKLCLHLAEQPLDIVIHNAGVQQLRNYFDAKSKAISIQDENMINLTASYLLIFLLRSCLIMCCPVEEHGCM